MPQVSSRDHFAQPRIYDLHRMRRRHICECCSMYSKSDHKRKAMRCPRTITQHLPIQMHTPQTVSGGGSECLACPHGKYKNKTVSLFPPPRLSSFLSVSIFHSACGFGHREVGHVLSAVRMRMPQAKETWVSIRACATQVQL